MKEIIQLKKVIIQFMIAAMSVSQQHIRGYKKSHNLKTKAAALKRECVKTPKSSIYRRISMKPVFCVETPSKSASMI